MRAARRLYKLRVEVETLGCSLEEDLESGESLTGQPTVRILERVEGGYEDRSNQFGIDHVQYATVTLPNGDTHRSILFSTGAAATDDDQVSGIYYIEAQGHTDTNRSPVAADSRGHMPILVTR